MRLCKINLAIVRYVTYVDIYINIWIKPYANLRNINMCRAFFIYKNKILERYFILVHCRRANMVCMAAFCAPMFETAGWYPFYYNTYYNATGDFLAGNNHSPKQRWAKLRLSTFDLYPGGGEAWGAGTNM
jgi:hypothetical protein